MRALIKLSAVVLVLTLLPVTQGCFKQVTETRQALPDIIWPQPPAIPRIRFVNSISGAEDVNIRQNFFAKFFRFLKGEKEIPLVNPYGITADREGRIFVVDNFHKQVHVLDEEHNSYYTFPKDGTAFISPIGIAIDNHGTLYISDSQEAVIKVFKENGRKYAGELGRGLLGRPTGLTFNEKTGELLVVDTLNSEIIRYDAEAHKVKGVIGKEGNTNGLFHSPTNIFTSQEGRLFVTDSLNFRVQVFTEDGRFLKTFGRAGDGPGYFSRPRGVAVDSDGNIYVVDALFDNVQIFDKEGRLLMDFGKPGTGYGEFWLPSGIFIDINDRIYISDSYNNRIQVFQYLKGGELSTP
ncbi:MAG: 6-bladed beta-propeller [Nitrospirae bacterium]|nr:6-bladed beta-propeller [Nitrospirota bacterium]